MLHTIILPRLEIKAGDGRSGIGHLVASKSFVKSTCSAAGDRPTDRGIVANYFEIV